MRDKLIEIMQKWGTENNDSFPVESVADFLLENGVIVPPCKVGTKIYYIFQYSDKRLLPFVREAKVKKIRCSNNKNDFMIDCECGTKKANEKVIRTWQFTDFGKTVFLDQEQAEAKLKEIVGK